MRTIVISMIFLTLLCSCSINSYNISDLESKTIDYSDLPTEIQRFISKPSDKHKQFTSEGLYIGIKPMICLDSCDFSFETVRSLFVKAWVDYYKMIDLKNGKSYKIDYGNPQPFIVFNNTLYIPQEYNICIGTLDTTNLKFIAYKLK